jgi:hypothetical protein
MPTYNLEEGTPQHQFAQSKIKIQMFGGGFGNGKTAALCIKALRLAALYPGSNGLLARDEYKKLNDTLRKEFFIWCPAGWIKKMPTKEDNSCYFKNGSVINFRYVAQRGKSSETGDTTSNLLSATYDWIGVDQVEDPAISYKDFLDLMGRLRGSAAYRPSDEEFDEEMPKSGPRWLMLTCNPTHNWVYKKLVFPLITYQKKGLITEDLIISPRTGTPMIELIEGSTYTNRKNLSDDFLEGMEGTYKGQMRERYLMGKWAAFEGLVYPEFDENIHGVSIEMIEAHLADLLRRHYVVEAFEIYDYGKAVPTCYCFGFVDDWGRVFILDGFYKPEMQLPEQAKKIKEIRRQWLTEISIESPINADPDMFKRKVVSGYKSKGETIADLFKVEHGIRMRPGLNDNKTGIAKVSAYLNGAHHIENPFTGARPGPLFYYSDRLEFISNEFQNYFWRRNPMGSNMDEPMDRDDHFMTALKYGLSKLPSPSELHIPASALPKPWEFWHEIGDE